MVLHDIDSNSTWVEALKNRTEGEMIICRTRALACMKICGITHTHQVPENEASSAYKETMQNSGMTYQLVPSEKHRRNLAEKVIQTWREHFIGVLCGTAASFLMNLWCQLIP